MSGPEAKFRAKRGNEHVKAVYGLANTLAAAIALTAFIVPAISKGADNADLDAPGWLLIAFTIHLFGHFVIWRYMALYEEGGPTDDDPPACSRRRRLHGDLDRHPRVLPLHRAEREPLSGLWIYAYLVMPLIVAAMGYAAYRYHDHR